MMATVQKMKTKHLKTFGDFCDAALNYVKISAKYANRIDLVFDSYINKSMKHSARKRRQNTSPIELSKIKEETPLPVETDKFWGSNKNKQKFQCLLHEKAQATANERFPSACLVISTISGEKAVPCQGVYEGSSSVIPELNVDIEEADQHIIPHMMHDIQKRTSKIIVLSPDTDVFVMLMYYWDEFKSSGLSELWVKRGCGDSISYIPIHLLASIVGLDFCKVLPAVHTLPGCDYISKVGSKRSALRAYPEYFLKGFGLSTDESNL